MSAHLAATSMPGSLCHYNWIHYTVHVMLVLLLCNANAMHHNTTLSDQILVCTSFRRLGIS
jgi:hypothetical protein